MKLDFKLILLANWYKEPAVASRRMSKTASQAESLRCDPIEIAHHPSKLLAFSIGARLVFRPEDGFATPYREASVPVVQTPAGSLWCMHKKEGAGPPRARPAAVAHRGHHGRKGLIVQEVRRQCGKCRLAANPAVGGTFRPEAQVILSLLSLSSGNLRGSGCAAAGHWRCCRRWVPENPGGGAPSVFPKLPEGFRR